MSDAKDPAGVGGEVAKGSGGASIMEGGKRQAEGEAAIQDRETRKKAKVGFRLCILFHFRYDSYRLIIMRRSWGGKVLKKREKGLMMMLKK